MLGERPCGAHVAELPFVAGMVEWPCVARVVEWLCGAHIVSAGDITGAPGMALEDATGAAAGGRTA